MPTFSQAGTKDISILDEIGKIVDNSDFSMPLVVFNSNQLQAFSYQEHMREFAPVTLIDEDNLANLEIPRYFKAIYIPDDRFMLVGGLERLTPQSSARCFSIDERGQIRRVQELEYGRQYFTSCVDIQYNEQDPYQQPKKYLYVISGYNHEYGGLHEVERFSFDKQMWDTVEPINIPRINASACKCGNKYIYLIGGLDL